MAGAAAARRAGGGGAEVAGRSMAAAVVRGGAAGWRRWHGRVMGKDRPGSRRARGAGSGLAPGPERCPRLGPPPRCLPSLEL